MYVLHQGYEVHTMERYGQNFLNTFYDPTYSTEAIVIQTTRTARLWLLVS